MRIRVSSAFVTRWNEEWKISGDSMLKTWVGSVGASEHKERIERFLEAMGPEIARALKSELLQLLLEGAAAKQAVEIANNSKLVLDTAPPII